MAGECIMCGKCLEVCPLINATNREELGPRAKADLYSMLREDESLLTGEDAAQLANFCLGCHRCKKACSQGVDVPAMVATLRGEHPNFKSWLWKTWLTNAKTLWSKSSSAAKLIPKQFQPEKFGPFLKMLAGLEGGPGLTPFLEIESFPDTHKGERVLLFAGCTANFVQARWLMAALRLLDGLGVEVLTGDFQCCGGGLKGAGFSEESTAMAAHNVDVWRKAGKPKVVTFCASCLSGLDGYKGFVSEAEQLEWLDSLQPLASMLGDVTVTVDENAPESIGYHRPCHADLEDSDYQFLKHHLGGYLSTQTQEECCGFGGIMRLGAPTVADQANATCWGALGQAEIVTTGCSACAAQLSATALEGIEVGHWLEMVK